MELAGRYRLGPRIGRGGMALVHSAWDEVLERTVAVKLLRHTLAEEGDHERFAAEARMLAKLDHPGLVSIYDTGVHDDQPYLVMELVDGTTLAKLLTERRLSEDESLAIGAALAEVLTYVHGRGVTHRDVKPSNVLIDHQNHVLLADFGIARGISATATPTAPGMMVGSAPYLSPEQVRAEEVGPAADVYALALVLIECLSGERVYTGSPDVAALARLLTPPPVDAVPAPLRALLNAMTATGPADRPDAAAVAAALRGHLGVEVDTGTATLVTTAATVTSAAPVAPVDPAAVVPVPTGPADAPARPRVPLVRTVLDAPRSLHRAVVAGALAGVLVVAGVAGVTLLDGGAAPRSTAQAPSPTAPTALPPDPRPVPTASDEKPEASRPASRNARPGPAPPSAAGPAQPQTTATISWAELMALLAAYDEAQGDDGPGDDGQGRGDGRGPGRGQGQGQDDWEQQQQPGPTAAPSATPDPAAGDQGGPQDAG